jgi:transcriptional regulator with XRE-family HTH domain
MRAVSSGIGATIRRHREARGWSQERLARELCRAAGVHGAPVGRQEVSRWERGRRTPRERLPLLAAVLDLPAEAPTAPRQPTGESPAPADQRRDDYAESIRRTSARLVALDNAMNGLPIADAAARSFKAVHRRLGTGDYDPRYERDIRAAAAELAEVAGWALFDAEQHDAARRFNQEALLLANLAGDSTIELLILQNMAMQAGWLGRHREELAIARSVIERRSLSPRVEAIFRVREAKGLAGSGQVSEAARAFDRARALTREGERHGDPPWAWWITDDEIDGNQGFALQETGQWRQGITYLQRAVRQEAGAQVGYRAISAARLLTCYLHAGAWRDAEALATDLAPTLGETASTRTLNLLRGTACEATALRKAPCAVRDALHHLASATFENPYDL